MHDQNHETATEPNASEPDWRALPFDAATNFSLLGWILDKLIEGKKSQEKVDLRLDGH